MLKTLGLTSNIEENITNEYIKINMVGKNKDQEFRLKNMQLWSFWPVTPKNFNTVST